MHLNNAIQFSNPKLEVDQLPSRDLFKDLDKGTMLDLPVLPDNSPGHKLANEQLAQWLAPAMQTQNKPLDGPLPDTGMTAQIAQNASQFADNSSPTSFGQLLAELFVLAEKDHAGMMAAFLGNALAAIDESGFFGNGGFLEGMVKEDDGGGGLFGGIGKAVGGIFGGDDGGGGLFGGIGKAIGGIFGGGDGGGGLFGGIGKAIGGIFGDDGPLGFISDGLGSLLGDDVGNIIGGITGAITNFASGNFLGGALTAFDTVASLMDRDGDDPTLNTIGGFLGLLQENFGNNLLKT